MPDTLASLRGKIQSAGDLKSVVRTMKALAASNIIQYEKAVGALDDYYQTVQLGLLGCFHQGDTKPRLQNAPPLHTEKIGAIILGSDQGLVGQFNDVIVDHALEILSPLTGNKKFWAIGERVHSRLIEENFTLANFFHVPNAVGMITPLIGQILTEIEACQQKTGLTTVYLFYNRPTSATLYQATSQRLLPLDKTWQQQFKTQRWPTRHLPQVLTGNEHTLHGLIYEYLFVSLFRACVHSLASENASRLTAMQRAEKNIDELLEELKTTFHRLRQNAIDEELFDVTSGFEALLQEKRGG